MKNKGITLLEMMLVLGLGSLITLSQVQQSTTTVEQERTRSMAKEITSYSNAVLSHISYYSGLVTESYNPVELNGKREGTPWLKSQIECSSATGSATKTFLPCSFLEYNNDKFGFSNLKPKTYLKTIFDVDTERPVIEAITVLSIPTASGDKPWTKNGETTLGLSGLTALLVNSSQARSASGVDSITEATICIDGTTRSDICASSAIPDGVNVKDKIVIKSTNSSNSDIYLRTDGGNTMTFDIQFEESLPYNNREIRNVSRIVPTSINGLILGNAGNIGSDIPVPNMVIVDADLDAYGDIVAQKTLQVKGESFFENTITLTDGDFIQQNGDFIQRSGDIIQEGGNIITDGSIIAEQTVNSESVLTDILYDRNNTDFYIDPDDDSKMKEVITERITSFPSQDIGIVSNRDMDLESSGTISLEANNYIKNEANIFDVDSNNFNVDSNKIDLNTDLNDITARLNGNTIKLGDYLIPKLHGIGSTAFAYYHATPASGSNFSVPAGSIVNGSDLSLLVYEYHYRERRSENFRWRVTTTRLPGKWMAQQSITNRHFQERYTKKCGFGGTKNCTRYRRNIIRNATTFMRVE